MHFVRHKVSRLDTLAGLAIKHNVSVADIKRANGLLSDTAMFGRDSILVPTQPLQLGLELQNLSAQVLTGVGRDPVLNAEANAHPASSSVARIATSLNVVNHGSYPEDLPVSDVAWMTMCQAAPCLGGPGGEVEMADRSSEGAYMAPSTSAPTRQAEAVRRRRVFDENRSVSDSAEDYAYGAAYSSKDKAAPGAGYGPAGSGPDRTRLKAWFADLGKAIGDSVQQTVQKVKEAANQPALARPSMTSGFGSAADGVLSSLSRPSGQVSIRKPNATLGRAPFEAMPSQQKVGKAD